ncbi:hypothetical protein [Marinobacter sp.]|uniref:hypothetical protein n=1 Tax=Marinobacter sp. TaxID=50741 RepID=UPI0035C6CE1E
MGDSTENKKPQPILEDFMQNAFPLLFFIFFPGLMIGFYFSIPLGFVAAFVVFFMFRVHCHLLYISTLLEKLSKNSHDDRPENSTSLSTRH